MEDKDKKHHKGHGGPPGKAAPGAEFLTDISEKGAPKDGERQSLDRRLYMQFLVFTGLADPTPLISLLEDAGIEAVLYADINDPKGLGLLTMSEDPEFFATTLRKLLNSEEFSLLNQRHDSTLFGRTYAIGHEENLEDWLIHRSRRVVMNQLWPWAIWYPLKRTGEFTQLEPMEQGRILMEHGTIGRAFGKADLGHDVRLACHGLDRNDNDFVIGLIGKDLTPLSILVQTMRSTRQTSTYIKEMGPFFIGRAIWQSGVK